MYGNIQNEYDKLMHKNMDRKDFLKHVGVGFAGIMGLTAVLKTLSNLSGSVQSAGYGSGAYGGSKVATKQMPGNRRQG